MKPFVKIIAKALDSNHENYEYTFIINGLKCHEQTVYDLDIFNNSNYVIDSHDMAKHIALLLIGYNVNVYDQLTNGYKLLNNLGLQYPFGDIYNGIYCDSGHQYRTCWFVNGERVYVDYGYDPLDTLLNHLCEEYSFVINECYDEDLKDDIEYL